MFRTAFTECRMYETPTSVVLVPIVADADEEISTLKISRVGVPPEAQVFPSSLISVEPGAQAPPDSSSRVPSTIAAFLGVIPLGPGDWRMLVVTKAETTPSVPYVMNRVVSTRLVPLCGTQGSSTPAAKNYERLLDRFLSVKSLYYAGDWDVTLNVQRRSALLSDGASSALPLCRRAEPRFFWNSQLLQPIMALENPAADRWALPAMMAFVQAVDLPGREGAPENEHFTLALVSRRSRHRAGTRLFMRGIDEEGNVANNVETEQLVVMRNSGGEEVHIASFVQTRGSIPAFWSQLPAIVYKPRPTLTAARNVSVDAAAIHFKQLNECYGAPICCVNLVDHKGGELVLAQEYAAVVDELKKRDEALFDIHYTAFDFHKECKGGRTDKLNNLLADLIPDVDAENYCSCVLRDGRGINAEPISVQTTQKGVFRTNCVDNLDRTNVVQSMIAKHVLTAQLRSEHLLKYLPEDSKGDSLGSETLEFIYKNLWADNADAVSTQYSGTGALKTDITRTGKRTIGGLVNDGVNSCMRYVKNNFYDGDLQDAYNYFLLLHNPVSDVPHANTQASSSAAATSSMTMFMFIAVVVVLLLSTIVSFVTLFRGQFTTFCAAVLSTLALVFYAKTLIKNNGRQLVNNPVLPITLSNKKST